MNANRYGKFPFFLGTFYTFHLTDGTIKKTRMILTRVKWGTHPMKKRPQNQKEEVRKKKTPNFLWCQVHSVISKL